MFKIKSIKNNKINTQGKGFTIVEILLILVISCLILVVGLYLYHRSTSEADSSNQAERQSIFLNNYAKTEKLEQFRTNGDDGNGLDNTTPWYEIYYKTALSTVTIKNSLVAYLKTNGYKVSYAYYNPAPCWLVSSSFSSLQYGGKGCSSSSDIMGQAYNGGQSYWVVNATKPKISIEAEITNISYEDSSDTGDLYKNIAAEHPVPQGFKALNFSLTDN